MAPSRSGGYIAEMSRFTLELFTMAHRLTPYRLSATPRLLGCGLLCCLLSLSFAVPPTQAQALYAVQGVAVDESAASELEAKNQGILKAKQEAFRRLVNRLTDMGRAQQAPPRQSVSSPSGSAGNPGGALPGTSSRPIAMPDPEELELLIRDVTITNERFGGGRYLANVSVRFQADGINRILQNAQAAYLPSPSPLAVILPLFRDVNGAASLWDETSPWLDAWLRTDGRRPIVPYVVPLGDLSDISAIDAARLAAVDAAAINAIAALHQAGAVIVPAATIDDRGNVSVDLATYGTGWPGDRQQLRFRAEELNEKAAALFASNAFVDPMIVDLQLRAAALKVAEALDARWKAENMLRFDQEALNLVLRAPLNELSDWLTVRSSLDNITAITRWHLAELNTDYAMVEVTYLGNEARLGQSFANFNFNLVPDPRAAIGDPEAPRLLVRR